MRLTVGPLPPAVYWRRRALVLGGVLVVLFLVAQACMSAAANPDADPDASEQSPTATATAATTPPATPTASATPTGSVAPAGEGEEAPEPSGSLDPADEDSCTDQEMLITAETDAASFPGGTSVQFTIRIRNGSDRTCRRDIGGDHRELYLRKGTGATKVWSSRDCDGPTGGDIRDLEPGFATSYYIVWHGRSSPPCEGDEPSGAVLEPGDYQLVARLGTAYGEPVAITVTG